MASSVDGPRLSSPVSLPEDPEVSVPDEPDVSEPDDPEVPVEPEDPEEPDEPEDPLLDPDDGVGEIGTGDAVDGEGLALVLGALAVEGGGAGVVLGAFALGAAAAGAGAGGGGGRRGRGSRWRPADRRRVLGDGDRARAIVRDRHERDRGRRDRERDHDPGDDCRYAPATAVARKRGPALQAPFLAVLQRRTAGRAGRALRRHLNGRLERRLAGARRALEQGCPGAVVGALAVGGRIRLGGPGAVASSEERLDHFHWSA